MKHSFSSCLLVACACLIAPIVQNAAAKDGAGLKKRIAVMTFEDKTNTGNLGSGVADKLTTALVKSGKYIVLERMEMEKVLGEQSMGLTGAVTEASAAKAGKILGVELMVMGAVTEFGQKESSVGGRGYGLPVPGLPFGMGGGGASVSTSTARVGIDLRLVNASTGEIVAAENVAEEESKSGLSLSSSEFSFSNDAGWDNTLAGKASHKAINRIVDLVNASMSKVPWSGKILKINADNTLYIKPGTEGGVQNGDVFVVYTKGEDIIDPDTDEPIASEETKAGAIEVVDVKDKMARAKITSGSGFKAGDMVRDK